MKRIIIVYLMLLFLTGCSYYELDNIALASTINVNCTNEYCDIKIFFSNKNVKPLYVKGKTFKQMINKVRIKTPLNIEFNHLNAVIINKDIDPKSYKEVLNYFNNKTNNFYVFISSNSNNTSVDQVYRKIKDKTLYKTSTYKDIKKNNSYILGSTNLKDCYLVKDCKIVKHLTKKELIKIKKETK